MVVIKKGQKLLFHFLLHLLDDKLGDHKNEILAKHENSIRAVSDHGSASECRQ